MNYVSKLFLSLILITGLAVAGCGDKKEEKKEEKKKDGEASVQVDNNVASATTTGEWKQVSLQLPKMT